MAPLAVRSRRHGCCERHVTDPSTDSGFSRLVAASRNVQRRFVSADSDEWRDSPFEWLKKIPSPRTRGAQAERLVARWLSATGFAIAATGDTQADLLVNGRRAEVKMSTPWKGSGTYRFQQIRDQDYDFMICIGLSPSEAHCWVLSKALLLRQVIRQGYGQHGGAGSEDTAWLAVDPHNPQSWLLPRNGDLNEALTLVREATLGS